MPEKHRALHVAIPDTLKTQGCVTSYHSVTNTGWHGYAEDSAHIASDLAAGRLTLRYQLCGI